MPKKILVVDDEKDMINIVSFRLKKAGYDVMTAETGLQALEKVRAKMPDLILLDINLPGMTGYEVCGKLKSDAGTKNIPVIFISASDENIEKSAEEYGADGFIIKPFEPQELISKIAEYVKVGTETAKTNKYTVEVDEEIRKLIPDFIQAKNNDLATLKEASEKNDMEKIQSIGHVWRGSGSLFSFNYVTEKGAALEAAAKNGKTEEIRELLPEIELYFKNLKIKYIKAADNKELRKE